MRRPVTTSSDLSITLGVLLGGRDALNHVDEVSRGVAQDEVTLAEVLVPQRQHDGMAGLVHEAIVCALPSLSKQARLLPGGRREGTRGPQ